MILINLLPHREAARKLRREMFYAALGASAFAGLVIAGAVWLWFSAQISSQQNRNTTLSNAIKALDSQIKDIASLQEEISALRARQQAVEDLQADRNMPVHLLNELVKQLPDGVYLTSMQQNGNVVSLAGVAQSNERISELLRNLSNNSPWLSKPELAEIVAGNVALSARDARRVAVFRMTVRLVRAAEAKPGASAPVATGTLVPTSGPVAAAAMPVASAAVASAAPVAAAPAAKPVSPAPAAAAAPAKQ